MVEYLVHDNGARPFKVCIEPEDERYQVRIYIRDGAGGFEDVPIYDQLAEDYYVGTDEVNVLVCLRNQYPYKYLFIGASIWEFQTADEIVCLGCKIGNSDVPYSWARDVRGKHYLLTEKASVDAVPGWTTTPADEFDPYSWYYRCINLSEVDEWPVPIARTPVKEFYLGPHPAAPGEPMPEPTGDDLYMMRWYPDPGAEFDRYCGDGPWGPPRFKLYGEDELKTPTREEFIEVIQTAGAQLGLEPIELQMIHDRP